MDKYFINLEGLPEYKATSMWDQKEYITRLFADHQNIFLIRFKSCLDRELMEKSVILSVYKEPLIAYSFREAWWRPYWSRKNRLSSSELFSYIENPACAEESINNFIFQKMDPRQAPQIKVLLCRVGQKDTLCMLFNHCLTDGLGSKKYIYLVLSLYRDLQSNPDLSFEFTMDKKARRSFKLVGKNFSFIDKVRILRRGFSRRRALEWQFPWEGDWSCVSGRFFSCKLKVEYFDLLKKACAKLRVSVNDVLLTAFYRSLLKQKPVSKPLPLTIFIPADLRHYIHGHKVDTLSNFSSGMELDVTLKMDESFFMTLVKIRSAIKKKTKYMGLENVPRHLLLYKLMPFKLLKRCFEKILQQSPVIPPILTNVGMLHTKKMQLPDAEIEEIFSAASIPLKGLLVTAISFKKELYLNSRFYGTDQDESRVRTFINDMIKEIIMFSKIPLINKTFFSERKSGASIRI
jgi:NRPS condensation-like uncharacterized protein